VSDAITVAAIDDHPIVLHGLAGILANSPGFQLVATAATIDELLAGPGRDADVVLLDLDLGQGSDSDTKVNIQRLLNTGTAVVVFSANAVPKMVRAAMRSGASGFVPKTDDLEGLTTAIRAAASGTGWVSPQLAFLLFTDDAEDRPNLSAKELEALRLYGAGLPMKLVAKRMNISVETSKQYIERVRLKYRKVGRDADTKIDLYRRAVEDGHLPPDEKP